MSHDCLSHRYHRTSVLIKRPFLSLLYKTAYLSSKALIVIFDSFAQDGQLLDFLFVQMRLLEIDGHTSVTFSDGISGGQ